MIAEMARDAVTAKAEIAKLKFQLARYRRAEFGRSSEKLAREIEQLELAIESLETDQAERLAVASPIIAADIEKAVEKQKPARRPLPEQLPREEVRHPVACACPHCGGALRRIGEEVTETLDYVPGRFKVVRHVRAKLSCRACDTVIAAPAPDHAIASRPGRGGTAGAYRRLQVRRSLAALSPSRDLRPRRRHPGNLDPVRLGRRHGGGAAASGRRHGGGAAASGRRAGGQCDGLGHAACGRHAGAGVGAGHRQDQDGAVVDLCSRRAAVRRLLPSGGIVLLLARPQEPALAKAGGEHPKAHLQDFRGVIHADGYSGFNGLFVGNRISEAACWAHVRRKFFDVHAATGSSIAKQALDRIGELYGIERTITGRPPDQRRAERHKRSKPIAEALRNWAEATLPKLSRKSELAKAFRYMRARWKALLRCLDDGRLALDNNPAERALRGVAIGRKNYLFAGSDAGGRRAAALYSLIETATTSPTCSPASATIRPVKSSVCCLGTGNPLTSTAPPPDTASSPRAYPPPAGSAMAVARRPPCRRWKSAGRETPNRSAAPAAPADGPGRSPPPTPAATGPCAGCLVASPSRPPRR